MIDGQYLYESVLIVDDIKLDRYIVEQLLRYDNIARTSHTASSVTEAMEYLETAAQFPDLILLDIYMPQRSGGDFLDAYSKMYDSSRSTIVVMTSSLNESELQWVRNHPYVSQIIIKPLTKANFTRKTFRP